MALRIGIVGGAGYTAGELLRILINHSDAQIDFVYSTSQAGRHVYETHNDLLGETDLIFTDKLNLNVDVLFLCLGHGKSVEFLTLNNFPDHVRIIDLSQDFRINGKFDAPNAKREFIYGLPELNKNLIKTAKNIANPGCFATAFELALLPLAAENLIKEEVHVNGITGSTGAGQSLSETTHFSWRSNNISIYKAFNHQHLKEVRKILGSFAGSTLPTLNFIPLRGNFSRGIFLSAYTKCDLELDQIITLYKNYYKEAAFTFVSDIEISLKNVINTNKCFLKIEKYEGNVLITSVIDNLTKGASGQAVQNMNIMFGLDEKTGLSLTGMGF
jgi:N-acetyl-gamma-glutamyl-phosphate reductase